MRRPPLGFLALALSLAQPGPGSAQQLVQQVRAASPDGAVRIQNLAGSVRVTGWDRDSIAVSGDVSGNAQFAMNITGPNAKLGVWTEAEPSPASHLEVRVPARSRVWIRTSTADVTVSDVRGGVDVITVAGAIDVRGQPAEVYAESMGGTVTVEVDSRLLRVRTAGGDIAVRGRVLDAEAYTVSGLIQVLNKQVERGRFESVDGGIRYTGWIGRASSVEFVTHAGSVELAVPTSLAADVRISSYQGRVSSQLGRLVRTGGSAKGGEYTLTLGGGGADVVIRTFKGEVRLRPM